MCVQNYSLGGFAQNRISYDKNTCVDTGQQLQGEKRNKTYTHTNQIITVKRQKFKIFNLIPEPYIFKGGIAKEPQSVCVNSSLSCILPQV